MTTQAVRTQSEATAAHQESPMRHVNGLLVTIAKDLAFLNEWLAGPATTERERRQRILAETEPVRHIGPQGF